MATKGKKEILYDFVNQFDEAVHILNEENVIIYQNKIMINLFGNLLGESTDVLCTEEQKNSQKKNERNKKKSSRQVYMGEALYSILSYQIEYEKDEDSEKYQVEIFRDISSQKRAEAQFLNSYNKLIKEIEFAKGVQQGLLPIDDKYWNMLELKSIYLPADDLGGDIYDLIKLSDHEVLLYIADVAGHGLRASLITVLLRERIKGLAETITNEGLDKFTEILQEEYASLGIDAEMYLSAIFCKYDSKAQELSFVNAGHNCYPMILRKKGRIEVIPVKGSPITGISIGNTYVEETLGIYTDDRVLLYTDGIIEEYSEKMGTEFGIEGIRNVVDENTELNSEDLIKKIVKEAGKHSKSRAKDDRSIIAATIL